MKYVCHKCKKTSDDYPNLKYWEFGSIGPGMFCPACNIVNMSLGECLNELANLGGAPALVNDDDGKWTVLFDGFQSVDSGPGSYVWFVDEDTKWYPTPLEAVREALKENS